MKKLKQIARLLVFVGLILLAGIGVGISGGVPIPLSKNRRDSEKEPMELVEGEEENSDGEQKQIKD